MYKRRGFKEDEIIGITFDPDGSKVIHLKMGHPPPPIGIPSMRSPLHTGGVGQEIVVGTGHFRFPTAIERDIDFKPCGRIAPTLVFRNSAGTPAFCPESTNIPFFTLAL